MERKWLKSVFRESGDTDEGSQPKRMRFSDLSTELHEQFPGGKFSTNEVSQFIHQAFPHTKSKPCGKNRLKHIIGLERISGSLSSPAVSPPTTLTPSYSDLLVEIQQLKDRVKDLEKMSPTSLCHEADEVIHHKSSVTQGPSSIDGTSLLSPRDQALLMHFMTLTLAPSSLNCRLMHPISTSGI